MVELENTMVPRLNNYFYFWGRYADDIFTFVKEESITFVLQQLNSYHPNLQFSYELEKVSKIYFLEFLVLKMSE